MSFNNVVEIKECFDTKSANEALAEGWMLLRILQFGRPVYVMGKPRSPRSDLIFRRWSEKP